MSLNRLIKFTLLICCLFAATLAFARDEAGNVYQLPMAETQEVATQWLEQNGFQVYRFTPPGGSHLQLTAERGIITFELILKPQSPLATNVRFHSNSAESAPFIDALKIYLDGYLNLSSPSKAANAESLIPAPVQQMQKAVVCIYTDKDGQDLQVSGFVLDDQGLIICTAHDLTLRQRVHVVGSEEPGMTGRVVRIDNHRDLALIRSERPLADAVSLQDGRYLLRNGEPLFAVTCPVNNISGIQPGFLDGPPRRVQGLPLWQVRMHIAHGSSGSPVFDAQGRLAAIITGRFRGTDSIGFLIPFETLLHFLEKY